MHLNNGKERISPKTGKYQNAKNVTEQTPSIRETFKYFKEYF